MKRGSWVALAAVSMLAQPVFAEEATSAVEVRFVVPERFADIGLFGTEANRNRKTLEAMFHGFAAGCLADGQRLQIHVLDVKLAGESQPWRYGGDGPRVMLDRAWPRVKLYYVLRDAAGDVLAEERETVRDANYLARSQRVAFDHEPLPYEREMLGDWFRASFCPEGADSQSLAE